MPHKIPLYFKLNDFWYLVSVDALVVYTLYEYARSVHFVRVRQYCLASSPHKLIRLIKYHEYSRKASVCFKTATICIWLFDILGLVIYAVVILIYAENIPAFPIGEQTSLKIESG